MKSILLPLFLFCSFSMMAQESMMQDVSYSYLDKLIATARANNPKYKKAQAEVNMAKANVTRSKVSYLDFVTLSYIYNPNNSVTIYDQSTNTTGSMRNPNLLSGYQIGVFLNAGQLLQKPSLVRMAKEQLNAQRYEQQESDMELETEIKNLYITYLQFTNHLKLKTKSMTDAEAMLQNIKHKFERGEVTFESYNAAVTSHAGFTEAKINAEAALLMAKNNLEEKIGTKLENVK